MTDNLQIMTQLYHNPEISDPGSAAPDLQISARRVFFFSMQTLQSSGAHPTVIWP